MNEQLKVLLKYIVSLFCMAKYCSETQNSRAYTVISRNTHQAAASNCHHLMQEQLNQSFTEITHCMVLYNDQYGVSLLYYHA